MVKRMLIDATHAEESRVVVINGNRLEEYDVETSTKKQIKGNIYLAKVTRVEPSLQAAFVDYGGNRHGFLAFSEIHSDYYQIPVADREALTQSHTRNVKDAEIVEDNVSDGEDSPKKEKKPTRSRSRRKPRAKDKDETVEAADGDASPVEATATADATTSPDSKNDATTGSDEEDAKPRRRRTRNRRKKSDEVDASTADADAKDASPSEDNTSDANTDSDGDDTPTGGNAAMSAEVAELTVDIDADGSDGDTVSEINAKSDEEDIEDLGGDDADEFVESHSRQLQKRYKIQEVIKRRQILLVQVVKEERGNKGAALSTFLSLAGRYCVLMPNTPRGGGISRKITNAQDRKRLKSILAELEIPDGMAVIVRTAGAERTKAEIKRDFDYLMRLWDRIRETTLQSQAPCLIYEEADLIKRSIRDLYARDVDEVLVEGDEGYRIAKDFMKMLMPSHAKRVQPYKDQGVPLFHRFQVESQLDAMLNPVVQLKSGGYIVINPTEALVAIDVNSGRSTRERNIEETAYKTNLEAAEELARQLRLRDLAGLIVVDFIDMEDHRNQGAVERKIKEAMRNDRARLQIGRISPFGLLEMSRQRLRPSLVESAFEVCTHCRGVGLVRSIESAALHLLRVLEEEGMRRRSGSLTVHVASEVALYILNRKRETLAEIEQRYGFTVMIFGDDSLISPDHRIERSRAKKGDELEDVPAVLNTDSVSLTAIENPVDTDDDDEEEEAPSAKNTAQDDEEQGGKRRRRRRRRRGRNDDRDDHNDQQQEASDAEAGNDDNADQNSDNEDDDDEESQRKRRRRGKRGGRRRSRRQDFEAKSTRSPNDDPALTAARRNRDHEAPDGAEENTVIDAESEGQDADSFDQDGVREGRSRSTTAPAPARPRRDRNDNRRNRRDRNDRPRGKDGNNDGGNDRGDVKNIPIQSGPAPEADANSKPDATAAAPASVPAEVAAPKAATPAPKPEEKVAPKAEKPAEKAPEPKAEAKPEPVSAEKPTPASEPAPAAEPAKDKKSEPKKRGWWSLGR